MPAEAAGARPADTGALLRSIALLSAWATALAAGEWLGSMVAARLWRIPAVHSAQPGSLPFYASLAAELAVVTWLFPRQLATPWLPARWSWLGLAGLLGALTCNALGGTLLHVLWGASFPSWHAPTSWLAFASGGILCPIVEEWIFRGVLWQLASEAVDQFSAPIRALVATGFTALLFAAWHIPFAGYTYFGYNLVFGAFLGLARWRFEAVAPGVAVHALGNSFYLLTG